MKTLFVFGLVTIYLSIFLTETCAQTQNELYPPWILNHQDLLRRGTHLSELGWPQNLLEAASVVSSRLYVPKQEDKCALVSESWELLHKNFAKEIDSYPRVIRGGEYYNYLLRYDLDFNRGVFNDTSKSIMNGLINNYSGSTGFKIDLVYVHYLVLNGNTLKDWNRYNVPLITDIPNADALLRIVEYLKSRPNARLTILSRKVYDDAVELLKQNNHEGDENIYPSTTMLATLIAKSACTKVDAFGLYVDKVGSIYRNVNQNEKISSKLTRDTYPEWNWFNTQTTWLNLVDADFHRYLYDSCPLKTTTWFGEERWLNAENIMNLPKREVCAVVLNGPELYTNRNYGKMIDDCDAVFRTNNHFPEQHLTNFMGKRTDYMIINALVQPIDRNTTKFIVDPNYKLWNDGFDEIQSHRYSELFRYIQPKGIKDGYYFVPSTGVKLFLFANSFCERIYIFGVSNGTPEFVLHNNLWESLFYLSMAESYPEVYRVVTNPSLECLLRSWLNTTTVMSNFLN